jgi:HAD superfamily hydrolase (TIGR01509 family)
MLRALVFDFDGIILDTETPLIDAYGAVYAEHGLSFDRAWFTRQVGHADYSFDPWKPFPASLDRKGLEDRRRALNRERTLLQPVLPGVRELLGDAVSEKLRLGVASNSSHEWVEPHLRRLGLHACFSFFGCKGDTPAPKPEPDIYRHVVNMLGCRPSEAVALEDSAAGVRAARRAGLWVLAVPNASTAAHDLDEAHWRASSLEGMRVAELERRVVKAASGL